MSIDSTEFRQALSHFASGVTVITTQHQGQLHGTTVSSFCSLSLEPPLVLVCLDLKATIHNLIVASQIFGVNIVAEHAEDISRHFSRRLPDKFSGINYHLGQSGVPLLEDALATLECRLIARYPGGDHSIFIGEVTSLHTEPTYQPLLYFRSGYGKLHTDSTHRGHQSVLPELHLLKSSQLDISNSAYTQERLHNQPGGEVRWDRRTSSL